MKATKYILITLFAAGTTLGAYAEDTAPERTGERNEKRHAKMLERFDKDADGKLSQKERKHAQQAQEKRESRGEKGERGEKCGECKSDGERGEQGVRGERKGDGNRDRGGKGAGSRT